MTSVAALLGRILCLATLIVTTAVMGNSHCQAGHGECSVDDDVFAALCEGAAELADEFEQVTRPQLYSYIGHSYMYRPYLCRT